MNELVIPGGHGVPSLHIHTNAVYALYHYLAKEAQRRGNERDPAIADAADLIGRARYPRRVQGYWSTWEEPITTASTAEEAAAGVEEAMREITRASSEAMSAAEAVYMDTIWPQRTPLLNEALATLREVLAPRWPELARGQGELLSMVWPGRIDAHLIPDCHDWRGGYSHPLTVDVSKNRGLVLCETMLHEATHVADLHTVGLGGTHLGERLMERLRGRGLARGDAWNIWHAVIFAASAWQVRVSINPAYSDYAVSRNLYSYLKVSDMPVLWEGFASGAVDEPAFAEAVCARLM